MSAGFFAAAGFAAGAGLGVAAGFAAGAGLGVAAGFVAGAGLGAAAGFVAGAGLGAAAGLAAAFGTSVDLASGLGTFGGLGVSEDAAPAALDVLTPSVELEGSGFD